MSSVALADSCHSCFAKYDTKSRQAKILPCYHTYCRQCLETYMYQNGIVTCLSCSKQSRIKSIDDIHNNPYMEQIKISQPAVAEDSGNGEELYYSDSDEDDISADSSGQHLSPVNNAVNNQKHIEGVKSMVINTQRANIQKTQDVIKQCISKIQHCKQIRSQREARLKESIQAAKEFKELLDREQQSLNATNVEFNKVENKISNLQIQLSGINLMDFETLQNIHKECLSLNNNLNESVQKNDRLILEEAVRQSTIKINFDVADGYIKQLGADKDTIFMKLCTMLEKDPCNVYLTTSMLAAIFTDKIATYSTEFKDRYDKKALELRQSLPDPLDDPTGYIDFIKSVQSMAIATERKERKPVTNGLPSPAPQTRAPAAEVSPAQSQEPELSRSGSPTPGTPPDNWKVVGKTSKKETKKTGGGAAPLTLSFSEMAKKPGNPEPRVVKRTVGRSNNRPRCFFKLQVDNELPFRVVIELRPDMAPKMADNFMKLCEGLPDGTGYKGSKIFRAKPNDHILGGDFEFNNGSGGHSAFEEKYFLAEQCPLKDKKGAIRMKGLERTADGRCKVGSQFMIWVGDLEYKEYKFTLVFGEVVEGFEQLQEVSRIKAVQKNPTSWILRQTVTIVDSGVL